MQDDLDGLFADPRPAQPEAPATAPDRDAIPDWLVANLRSALDAVGLESMDDRQALIVELSGRPVASLRDLTFAEARRISEQLVARKQASIDTRSSWDDRESDTWIDRM